MSEDNDISHNWMTI